MSLNPTNGASLLDDYFDEAQMAAEIKKSRRWLKRRRDEGRGPPVTWLGRTPFYHKGRARAWLDSCERPAPRAHRHRQQGRVT
jgi:hypothetical protein